MSFASDSLSQPAVRGLLLVFVMVMMVAGPKTRLTILQALIAFLIANELTDVFKAAMPTMRPFQEYPADVILRAGASDSRGTASAHSANNAAIAFVLTYQFRSWGLIWVAIALLVGISRVYLGVHYPWQVGLGWMCGIFAGWMVVKTWEAWIRSRSSVTRNEDATINPIG